MTIRKLAAALLFAVALTSKSGPAYADPEPAVAHSYSRFSEKLRSLGVSRDATSLLIAPLSVDGAQARDLLAVLPDVPRLTASTMKLFSSFAALLKHGPGYTFNTEVLRTGTLQRDGKLQGDLVIVGAGDPVLTLERWQLLLRRLRATGIATIEGNIRVDRSRFAAEVMANFDPAAFDGEPLRLYNASPDAFLVNSRSATVELTSDATSVSANLVTPLAGASATASLELVDAPCDAWRSLVRESVAADFSVKLLGAFPKNCGPVNLVTAIQLEGETQETVANLYVERLFRRMWSELGGEWKGRVVSSPLPTGAARVLVHTSPPMSEIVRDINKLSNNLAARLTFLSLSSSPSTIRSAAEAMISIYRRNGLDLGDIHIENGIGLSRVEAVSSRQLQKLIELIWRSPVMPEMLSALPVAGSDGTLKGRKVDLGQPGRLRLKTGSLRNVRAEAGVFQGNTGNWFSFVLMVQDEQALENYDLVLDAIEDFIERIARDL